MRTSHKIQILKTITWSLVSFAITTIAGWLITGSWKVGMSVGLIDRAAKMSLYFIHEKLWHIKYKKLKAELRDENG